MILFNNRLILAKCPLKGFLFICNRGRGSFLTGHFWRDEESVFVFCLGICGE